MKTVDITPRTVVYALQERSYRDPVRAVVLATDVHRMGSESVGPDENSVTLRPRSGEQFRKLDYRGIGIGLPVIKAAHGSESEVTDTELLAAAAALPELLDGPLPKVVGPKIHFHVVRSASIKMEWAVWAEAMQRGEQTQRNLADDEIRARNAVANLLHTYGVDTALHATRGDHGDSSTRVAAMDWETLYEVLSDLVTGVTATARETYPEWISRQRGES